MRNYRNEYKAMEQAFMAERDRYSELANALGFEGDAWFNDPLASHEEVVARASKLAALPQAIREANERLPGIETPLMRGDNLAVTLCTLFDDGEPPDDDTGWSLAATAGYEEVIGAIRGHYAAAVGDLP